MTWELAVCLFGLAGTVCSIFFGYMAFKRNQRTDEQQDGRESGTLLTEIGYIKANTDDLLRLVTDVLALSELDQYNKLPTNIQTDINMICQLSIEVAKMQKQDTVEFLFKPEREKLIILSNPERISQLLANLAHNAIKFTTHGSIELTYSVLEAEKKLEISVTDTGIGIPKEKQEKVFERFYKMNSFSQGTGLGLSISRTIAEKLGGSLHIDSSYTDGCRMVLTLPLVYAE